MKYLLVLLMFLIGCSSPKAKFQVGQSVMTDYCVGNISTVIEYSDRVEYTILNAHCGLYQYNFITIKETDIKIP